MKGNQKDSSEKPIWDRSSSSTSIPGMWSLTRPGPKLMVWLICFIVFTYIIYMLKLVSTSRSCDDSTSLTTVSALSTNVSSNVSSLSTSLASRRREWEEEGEDTVVDKLTDLNHVVFGIAASSKLWKQRKEYIKIWYKPKHMRGYVWLDKEVRKSVSDDDDDEKLLPPVKISGGTASFPYTNKQGQRSALRISRIVSETLRLGPKNVRWFVMGDDDTVFVTDNLIRVLRKYDHEQMYYIGSLSESHLQNIFFSYGMAYGGGGFAISYPLAKALSKMQDRCIQRYPALYGSDDRMQACMAELGVPLTKELGFHQYDVYGNLFGLLAAHPVTPFVSMHHLDVVEPIFPNMTRVRALKKLTQPMKLDSAGLLQQSICYDKHKSWTISVSWGYAVQIFRGIFSPREMEMPSRTFLNWYKRADYTAYAFNTRPVSRNPCQKPFVFYMSSTKFDQQLNTTVSEYTIHRVSHPSCRWKMTNPAEINTIVVYKKPDPHLWERSPRRNCCRVLQTKRNNTLWINVGVCRAGEVTEVK
ncbi:unnamed protein product [Arabidopsis lyrata]|uniref:Transferase, transferring glycosyl groups n=1 Tax=Arabidopsis lyrata subsp. lyrata TaxID=81972 RepID=D7M943_ARALL|nr:uncharacterized protein LOC9303778 [Arabidopsis lyrata subsp. lyrata]EFH43965.1 hypothetical protein ARALYDRAFT_492523 [Arabidopsis lyrata subsp. lyrata]CAH8275608.1 unnamed protein product [Arabidopsis lyrata]|eukprot:XP_020873419.1 uncharacterized protein LOC9303778 [Arabidopsis lyrata subsp. lyrata]